jgi:asparagine synthase (glutamine-hydrolysing)
MCRIAGVVSFKESINEELFINMRDSMKHGGPDSFGVYFNEYKTIALGHRRLSLLDMSDNGNQPMYDNIGENIIVYNGEIYNFQEIKDELISLGVKFMSNTDTEVILYAYRYFGVKSFDKFNGMFAFAILDKKNNKLVIARDPSGIKPLYYGIYGNKFCFASEVKAFKAFDRNWPENRDWQKYFLVFGFLPGEITTLENVYSLKKGSYLEYNLDNFKFIIEIYNEINYFNYTINDEIVAKKALYDGLKGAVKRSLISDTQIGVLLSGGFDSTLLSILSKPILKDNLHTISLSFDDYSIDESIYQKEIAKYINSNHHEKRVRKHDFESSFTEILFSMDQPSTDGINTYFVSKYTKELGIKAVLSGIGADEYFGGYPSFERQKKLNLISKFPDFLFSILGIYPNYKIRKFGIFKSDLSINNYLFNRYVYSPLEVARILDCDLAEVINALSRISLATHFDSLDCLEKVSAAETDIYMTNQLLKDTDFYSMAHGVEIRVPFLDKSFLKTVKSISPKIRFKQPGNKQILKDTFNDVVPKSILSRSKKGFNLPFSSWIKDIPEFKSDFHKLVKQLNQNKINFSHVFSLVIKKSNMHH